MAQTKRKWGFVQSEIRIKTNTNHKSNVERQMLQIHYRETRKKREGREGSTKGKKESANKKPCYKDSPRILNFRCSEDEVRIF